MSLPHYISEKLHSFIYSNAYSCVSVGVFLRRRMCVRNCLLGLQLLTSLIEFPFNTVQFLLTNNLCIYTYTRIYMSFIVLILL